MNSVWTFATVPHMSFRTDKGIPAPFQSTAKAAGAYSALVLPKALESLLPGFQAGTLPSKLEKHCRPYTESSVSSPSPGACINYTIRSLAEHEGFEPSCLSTTPLAGGHHQPLGQCSV